MKRRALYAAAALAAFATGVWLVALRTLFADTRPASHPAGAEDAAAVVLAFAGGAACFVLAAAGMRAPERDLAYNWLLYSLGAMLLASGLWTLTTMFSFESTEMVF